MKKFLILFLLGTFTAVSGASPAGGVLEGASLPTGEATGVFRAATGVAAAPPRGANPSFATEDFRAATGVAAAPQRGANPSFATGERGLIPVRKLSCALLMGNKAHPYKLGVAPGLAVGVIFSLADLQEVFLV